MPIDRIYEPVVLFRWKEFFEKTMKPQKVCGCVLFCIIIPAIILFAIHNPQPLVAELPSTMLETTVYFVIIGESGNLVAYIPDQRLSVVVRIDSKVSAPYIRVPLINDEPKNRIQTKEKIVAYGLGGTLYVKDRQQLKDLIIQ